MREKRTSDARIVLLWFPHEQRCRLAVERIGRVGIPQQLRQEHLEDVDHVVLCDQRRIVGEQRTIGDHVWLITSRQTEPESSSMFGWKILFMKPIDGDLYGY